MSSCCELPKVMHSRDKVQLTRMHDRQELDGNSGNIDSFVLREYLDCFLIVIKSFKA